MRMKVWGEISGERHLVGTLETIPGREEQFSYAEIYLKGLRYNLHLRPRSVLVEVGAQTNTYEEALNAMEPLAEIVAMVLEGT